MDDLLQHHADRIRQKAQSLKPPNKYLVAIAGSPGSGKTTAAHAVCGLVNKPHDESSSVPIAVAVSMDGFHYYRSQLDKMSDPEEAHARRGAHWTFDAEAFVEAVQRIRDTGQSKLPSFDHAYGDPVEDDVDILPEHRLVIIEGNYLLLDEEPWCTVKQIVDESWFVACDLDVAMQRVVDRQVGNGSTLEIAQKRVAGNDRPNAELIQQGAQRADLVIPSLPYQTPQGILSQLFKAEE